MLRLQLLTLSLKFLKMKTQRFKQLLFVSGLAGTLFLLSGQSAYTKVSQAVNPGQPTRSGPSYIAVGGNIGFGGSTALGRGNFAITSKIGLTNDLCHIL